MSQSDTPAKVGSMEGLGVSRDALRAAFFQLASMPALICEQIELQRIATPDGWGKWGANVPVSRELLAEPASCAEFVTAAIMDKMGCDLSTLKWAHFGWVWPEDDYEGDEPPTPVLGAVWLRLKTPNV